MAAEADADPMNLRVGELLKEVLLDYTSTNGKFIDDVVSSIKDAIGRIPEDFLVTADEAPGFVRDIGADKVEFKFKRPKVVEIGGSYSFRCIAKPDVNVDIFIRLPKKCFHEKDYLNHRYHAKRLLYLCILKKYLKHCSSIRNAEWSYFQNEARKPILVLIPAVKQGEIPGFSIRLIPTAVSLFSIQKLNVERNNIRALHPDCDALPATPIYNCSLLEDMLLEEMSEFVRRTFLEWKELQESLVLLKVWARHRSSVFGHDCLNGYLISVIIAFLATESGRNRINNSMTAMQIFRVTLDFIATSKLWDSGIFFRSSGERTFSKVERKKFLQLFPVVICDSSGEFNLAFRMTKSGLQELRNEAALALSCINKSRDGGFDEIFMTKIDFPAKFDHCIRLNLKGNAKIFASGFCLDNECWRLYEHKVHSLIQEGLGDRAKLVRVIWRNTASNCNIEEGFRLWDREPVLVGISVSLPEAFKIVIKGPILGNRDEALKFRKFWGDKAEVRHFKDSIARECVAWECKDSEKHLITKWITEHVLLQHLSMSKDDIMHAVDQLDFSLIRTCDLTTTGSINEVFNDLSGRLRGLDDIPLKVSSVQPLDSAFRGTSVCPPMPHPLADEKCVPTRVQKPVSTCLQSLEVMIQLEGSGNWPMDDEAIEKTKSAFLLTIGESLQKNWGMRYAAAEGNVDVFLSGYAFRLRILHERGLSLLRRWKRSSEAGLLY